MGYYVDNVKKIQLGCLSIFLQRTCHFSYFLSFTAVENWEIHTGVYLV